MSYSLGTASGEIITSYNGKGVDQAKKDIDGLTGKTGSGKGAINDISKAAGVAGLAIAGGFALAVNSAASFEQRMSAVKAVSGASAQEMDQLSKKAMQIGKDTSFSAGEAAQAIEELVKAGVSVPDVMNGAADATVALAAAGEIDLPAAAAIASNAMNQFNLSAQQMPHIADLIAGAANASAIDVKDFGFSLSQVGAVANLAGASFDDTAAAIALMGNAGIKGSDAGTSLKTMLTNLQPQTTKAKNLMKDLGLMTEAGANKFFTAEGKMKSFKDVAGLLQNSMKDLTQQQKQQALTTLFGSDAVRGAAVFANQGAAGFTKMATAMTKIKAADVAKTRLDNFKGSLEAMKGSLETAGIVVGTILLPALRSIVNAISGVLNSFLNLSPGVQKTILIFVAAVGAALLIVAAVIKITFAVQKVIEVMKILRLVMASTWAATLGPILLVIAIIALVVAAIVILWKRSETFRKIVTGAWNGIKTAMSAVLKFITGVLWPGIQAAWNGIVTGLKAVAGFFTSIWNGIKTGVGAVIAAITAVIQFYINIWITIFKTVFGVINAIITFGVNLWKTIISAVLGVITGIWKAFWGVFGGIITAAFNLIKQIFLLGVAIWDLIVRTAMFAVEAVIRAVWKVIVSVVTSAVNGLRAIVSAAWNFIKSVSITVWNAIKAALTAVWNVIKAVATTVFNAVKTVVLAVFNTLKTGVITIWNAIKNAITTAINAVRGPVTAAVNTVKNALTIAWNAVSTVTSRVWGALAGIVGPKIQAVHDKVKGVIDRIKGIFSGAASWLFNAGRDIIQGLLNGIESLINNVTSKLKSLTNLIPKLKGPPEKDKKLLYNNGRLIMQGLGDGIERELAPFLRMIQSIAPMIPSSIEQRNVQELIPSGLLPAASRIATPAPTQNAAAGTQIHLTTINPVGKTSVEELSDAAMRLSLLGVL